MIKFSLIHRVAYFLLSQGSPQAPVPSSSSVFQSHPCGSGVLLPGCGRTDLRSSACRGCGWPQTQEEGTSPSQPASHLGPCGLLARLQTAHEVMNPPKTMHKVWAPGKTLVSQYLPELTISPGGFSHLPFVLSTLFSSPRLPPQKTLILNNCRQPGLSICPSSVASLNSHLRSLPLTRPSKQVTQHHPHRLQLQLRFCWASQQSGKPDCDRT